MSAWAELFEVGRRHHQVVTVGHAEACGLHPATLRRRAFSERWERPHPGVFALPGSNGSPQRQVSAALLAVGGHVAACRRTAAFLWGLSADRPDRVDVWLPPGRRAPALRDVMALRSATVVASDLGEAHGLSVTGIERTVCDLAAVLDDGGLHALVLTGLRRGLLDLEALRRRHVELRRSPGAPRLERLLARLDRPATSLLEQELRVVLHARGLTPLPQPLWVSCRDGRDRRIAIPFVEGRVGVQLADADAVPATTADEDAEDDLELTAADWRITRVSARRFHADPERWLSALRRLLRP